jgi:tripartite-type tricarboxylate transporter receptor subunit TctC
MKRIASLLALVFFTCAAWAQTYPSRPVKVVVPWPPGQATDLAARLVAQKLQEQLGQPFVADNRPGAGGSIGSEVVARAPADGYTLLAASSGPISIMPLLQKTPYDAQKDFAPVSLIATVPFALVTHPSFPASNAREFVAKVRASPDKYTYGSSGTGASAHLFVELLNSMAKLQARHVPYKGSAPALADLIGGQIDYAVETVASTIGHVKSGRLKMLGTTFARRTAATPDVPTIAEAADLPGYDIGAWIGYTAPLGTPREIVARLSAEIQKAMQAADLKERFLGLGLDAASSTPQEMGAFLESQRERYASVIKDANIKLEQ